MELACVEVKCLFDLTDGDEAEALLRSARAGTSSERRVFLLDTRTRTLLTRGVILRVRHAADGSAEATVKVRGARARDAVRAWAETAEHGENGDGAGAADVGAGAADVDVDAGDAETSLFEGDQVVGGGVVEAFASTTKRPAMAVADVVAGAGVTRALFGPRGVAALEALGAIAWEDLVVCGPVKAEEWTAALPGVGEELTCEVWTAGPTKLVEVSKKVPGHDARALVDALTSFLAMRGWAALMATKVELALKALPA